MSKSTTVKYQVTVTTSNAYFGADGETNSVYIELTGENGEKTDCVVLREDSDPSFRRGETDVFEIETADVGLPVIVRLEIRNKLAKDPWAVRDVIVKYGNEQVIFPVHDWIEDKISVTSGEALLSHKIKHQVVLSMREQEVERSRALLQWVPDPGPNDLGRGLPRFVNASPKELPLIFRPTEIWTTTFAENAFDKGVRSAMGMAAEIKLELKDLKSYETLIEFFDKGRERLSYLDRWHTDEEFGRQLLNGITPTDITRCIKLPDVCKITSDDVREVLGGKFLQGDMKAGKIYISDYSKVYRGVRRNKNLKGEDLYCPDAICLCHVNPAGNLVPIAIQLVPNDHETVFTPKSSAEDWLLAKMYFRVALGNMHEWHYHFLLTHGVMEPFSVAVFRSFPRSHPVYKLLRPHLQTVSVINALARQSLIAKDSAANKALAIEAEDLVRHTFKIFHFDDLVIPEVIKKRGLGDKKLLPKFYYRDDALKLWEVIEEFVGDVIKYYYHGDHDIECDKDLQVFAKDMAEEGWGWIDGNKRGMPEPITSVNDLIRICTAVIFTSSAQHASVNFPQYDVYKYVPNAPAAMRLPPHRKGEATMQRIMDSLPDMMMSLVLMAITFQLSQYTDDEAFLGDYPVPLFTEPDILKVMKKYKKSLDKYADNVRKRNEKVEFPYVNLLPGKIPNSIAI